ncbi:MAG: alkaline phosphatase family protein [Nitrospirae bacterium]|nr:alkaline phosphatase family protein [Nitrospirota bacterium]
MLGFDGATYRVISPLIKQGKLPNLKRLMAEGTHGNLMSTIPAHSAAAWTSFATGKNPGKHGVYSFRERSYSPDKFVSSKSRRSKTFWGLMSEAGLKVGIVNIPITYPPDEVNGYMISGLDTPSEKSEYTFPKTLKDELNKALGRYIIEADTTDMFAIKNDKDRIKFFSGIVEALETRRKALKYLFKAHPVDVFAVAFMATDRIQHRCWHFYDPAHPHFIVEGNKKFGDMIPKVYERLDSVIGEVLEMVGDESTLIVMSDHGMGPRNDKTFYLKNWLISNGYLYTVKKDDASQINKISRLIKSVLILKGLDFVRSKLSNKTRHVIKKVFPAIHKAARLHETFSSIDWDKTRIYPDELMGVLRINLKGREQNGIVERGEEYETLCKEVSEKLTALKDPETGEAIISKVMKKEDIYEGHYTEEAPDLFIFWNNETHSSQPSPPPTKIPTDQFLGRRISLEDSSRALMTHTAGAHLPEGILLMRGSDIKKNTLLKNAGIIDIAPTLLHLMGLSVPKEMDGTVLEEAFTDEYRLSHPVKYIDKDTTTEAGETPFSAEDSKMIQKRLRDLGYLE